MMMRIFDFIGVMVIIIFIISVWGGYADKLEQNMDVHDDSIPLTAPAPILDQYEVRFARSMTRAYITEFEDSHGHHCIMGKHQDNIVLSCEGH